MNINQLKTISDIAEMLNTTEECLKRLIGDPKKYRRFKIPKSNGSYRDIHAPKKELKTILIRLKSSIEDFYQFPSCVTGFVKGKSIKDNANPHVNKLMVVNIDLLDYFPSIHIGRVRGMFMSKPFNLSFGISHTLATICTHNNILPQGSPASPIISNIIAYSLDQDLLRYCTKYGITYTRYADDLTFSTNRLEYPSGFLHKEQSVFVLGDTLRKIIEKQSFHVNNNKIYIAPKYVRQIATNLTINEKVNVNIKFIRDLRCNIHRVKVDGIEIAALDYYTNIKKYSLESFHTHKAQLSQDYINLVVGKINFLGMIRGFKDSLYNKYAMMVNHAFKHDIIPIYPTSSDDFSRYVESRTLIINSSTHQGTGFRVKHREKFYIVTAAHNLLTDKEWKDYNDSDSFRSKTLELENELFTYQTISSTQSFPLYKKSLSYLELKYDIAIFKCSKGDYLNVVKKPQPLVELNLIVTGYREYCSKTQTVSSYKATPINKENYLGRDIVKINSQTYYGMSGGPVFNNDYDVVGVIHCGGSTSDPGYIELDIPILESIIDASNI